MTQQQDIVTFGVGLPVIRISNSAGTTIRTCHFSQRDNNPDITRITYEPFPYAQAAMMADGTEIVYEEGVRFEADMTFEIWRSEYRVGPIASKSFTETDFMFLKIAKSNGYVIEFFPYREMEMGSPPHPMFEVNITELNLARTQSADGRVVWNVALSVRGKKPSMTMPAVI